MNNCNQKYLMVPSLLAIALFSLTVGDALAAPTDPDLPVAELAVVEPALPETQVMSASPELAELERRIAADREELRHLIGTRTWSGQALANDERLRELAESLPRLQRQLDELRSGAQ